MLPHFYALLCDAERIKKLLEEGTDPNIRDGDGNTPLHFAASRGCAEVARLLLKHGADPNAQDKSGETPLHVAAYEGCVDVVRLLLEHGADPNIQNENGWTPLHWAASEGCVDVVRHLLEHGADPSIRRDGKTPLDLAKERGHREVASLIEEWLRRGGEPSRPGAVPVRSVSDAVCEAYCEAWRIINQVYDFVREVRVMTSKELEDLETLLHIFKGHVEALERMTARPDAVKELISCFRDYIELLLPHLRREDLPGDALSKITSMRHRINRLSEELACRC
jgi:hypothetical protein